MTDETVHKSRRSRSRRALATYFRRLANALGRGEPVPVDTEQTVTVDPPIDPAVEVAVTQDDENQQLTVEMEWPDDAGKIDTEAAASKATFEVYEDKSGKYRWRLRHRNGNVIADCGQGYSSKQKAKQGLRSVQANAPGASVHDQSKDEQATQDDEGSDATFELFTDNAGKFRWRFRHTNDNIIADSGQGYSSKQKAKQGLRSVKINAPGAPVTAGE